MITGHYLRCRTKFGLRVVEGSKNLDYLRRRCGDGEFVFDAESGQVVVGGALLTESQRKILMSRAKKR